MKVNKIFISVAVMSLLSACGGSPKPMVKEPTSNLPPWVLNPVVEDGIAAADCVTSSSNFSIDQKMAASNARIALAQQLSSKVEALEKNYQSRTDSNEDITAGVNFTTVAKILTQQTLTGSRVVKAEVVSIGGKDHFCALMTMSPNATKTLFDDIITQSKRKINPQDEKFLYQEFKAQMAEKDLDKAIKNLTN
jgi:hypothetical protein